MPTIDDTNPGRRAEMRMKGYVGEPCPECGNFTLTRLKTDLKCDTCGGSTNGTDPQGRRILDGAFVYGQRHQIDVVVPSDRAFEFMERFGRKFAPQGTEEPRRTIRPVVSYHEIEGVFHVVVSISDHEIKNFYEFLREFGASP